MGHSLHKRGSGREGGGGLDTILMSMVGPMQTGFEHACGRNGVRWARVSPRGPQLQVCAGGQFEY
jgi:hypothetical protein